MSVLSNPVLAAVLPRTGGASVPARRDHTLDLALHGPTLVAAVRNHGGEAVRVTARSSSLPDTPASHLVAPGAEITAAWQCGTHYDLALHGPRGSHRWICGVRGEAQVEARLRVRGQEATLRLHNPSRVAIEVAVTGTTRDRVVTLQPFARRNLAATVADGSCQVALHVVGTRSHQLLAGRA